MVGGENGAVTRDDLQAIRIAVYEADHSSLVRILGGGVRSDVLQLVGDVLAAAAAERAEGARELAGVWGDALRERGWAGDEELAAELDAAMGRRPAPPGSPLPVDLEELSELLEAGLGEDGGRIDLETGEVWRASSIEYFAEQEPEEAPNFEDPDRWLYVGPEGSHEGYRDMEHFIATVDDPSRADRFVSPSTGAAPSGASRTPSPAGPTSRSAGTASRTNGGEAGLASGCRSPAIESSPRASRQQPDPERWPILLLPGQTTCSARTVARPDGSDS